MTESIWHHAEKIICQCCHKEQIATVQHTSPWWTYIHECECGYINMESEWCPVKEQPDELDG